jgi:hypothetical protein
MHALPRSRQQPPLVRRRATAAARRRRQRPDDDDAATLPPRLQKSLVHGPRTPKFERVHKLEA